MSFVMACVPGCKIDGHSTRNGICRNGRDQPLVVPEDGGKPLPYTRATTFAGALEDGQGLIMWKQAMTAIGLAKRPDLVGAISNRIEEAEQDWKTVKGYVAAAAEAGGASKKAQIGTDIHEWTEQLDRGLDVGNVPVEFEADLMAYQYATEDMKFPVIEQFAVLDEYGIGGTPDRIATYQGRDYIFDLKTGSIAYPLKMAIQLAIYSRAKGYDPTTRKRFDFPPVDQERGIICHLPAGSGQASLHWIDLTAGWATLDLCAKVRGVRSTKGITTPVSV